MHELNVHHLLVWAHTHAYLQSGAVLWRAVFLLFSQCCVAIRQTSKPTAQNVLRLEVQMEFMGVLPPCSVAAGSLSYRHAHDGSVNTPVGTILGERPLLALCS